MQLEEFWGVGPKTSATLEASIGVERAVEAIESGDLRTLVDAGIDRGRATRILRRAESEAGMDALATRDARSVYRGVLDLAVEAAVTQSAADRIRTLTPLVDRDAMERRQDRVERAREGWQGLDTDTQDRILEAYATYDDASSRREAGLRTAASIAEVGVDAGIFEPFGEFDVTTLTDAADALAAVEDDRVVEGADDELDRLRAAVGDVESLAASPAGVVERLRDAGVRDPTGFRDELLDHLRTETDVDPTRIRSAMPEDASDATTFVSETLRSLADDLRAARVDREETVRGEYETTVETARETIEEAVDAVEDVAVWLSLARFAERYDLTRPAYAEGRDALAVVDARNLTIAAEADRTVNPVTYAIGTHDIDADRRADGVTPPSGDQVTVLTGANSGGKTTLLETCCQVTLLASMGLPVPAREAEISPPDRIVFHRRHASFNAGVLESTLRSVVPPLSADGRTLMLVDEFEAITEPGRAADLLHGLVQLTVEENALGAYVTHLAEDLEPLPDAARIDGIVAEGLTPELELEVDYQPRFGEVGKSTPEFIVSRLLADADDPTERAGFRTLAESVGSDVVQRTLADARFAADE